jgi:hypothetical protein
MNPIHEYGHIIFATLARVPYSDYSLVPTIVPRYPFILNPYVSVQVAGTPLVNLTVAMLGGVIFSMIFLTLLLILAWNMPRLKFLTIILMASVFLGGMSDFQYIFFFWNLPSQLGSALSIVPSLTLVFYTLRSKCWHKCTVDIRKFSL